MAGTNPEPTEPRIVKKKKAHHGGHGGAWKVAYADFVTAMMALFIVLWIMSQSQSIRQNVAQYFKNPGVLPGATGLMETSDVGGEMPTPGHSQDLQSPSPVTPDLAAQGPSPEQVRQRLTEVIAQLPDLGRLKDQVLLEITPEGLRIELLDKENSHFFEVGSATLKPETKALLQHMAQELAKLPNQIVIEGHTDSRPYGSQTYTNWELSADRANAARRVMEAAPLRPGQVLSIKGYADQKLRNPQNPLDVQNRRVGILVLFPGKGEASPLPVPQVLENLGKPRETKEKPPLPDTQPVAPAKSPAPQAPPPTPKVPLPAPKPAVAPRAPGSPAAGLLEDKVRQELQELLKSARPGDLSSSAAPIPSREPRERLGW